MVKGRDYDWGLPSKPFFTSEEERIRIETENNVRLAEYVLDLIRDSDGTLTVSPEMVSTLHRLTIEGLYGHAGRFRRPGQYFEIGSSSHVPPAARELEGLVTEMCDYANQRSLVDPFHAAAYLLWRLAWIHPFEDGNGRVSRSVAYIALCVGFGLQELPGSIAIPDLILRHEDRYIAGLKDADREWRLNHEVKVFQLEYLLSDLVVEQAGEDY
ncbi:MAG: Fic family protein [Planctomycetaceae bacterium]|nr:Fic family protein [Planctomycetaceae bacterium]